MSWLGFKTLGDVAVRCRLELGPVRGSVRGSGPSQEVIQTCRPWNPGLVLRHCSALLLVPRRSPFDHLQKVTTRHEVPISTYEVPIPTKRWDLELVQSYGGTSIMDPR